MKRVSVVIPAFNCGDRIQETLSSVISEVGDEDEIIVIDDASIDNTRAMVSGLNCPKIRYFCLETNSGGPARPRNEGIKVSEGRFIALFDSDDIMLPGKLDKAVKLFEKHQELGLGFSDFGSIDEFGNFLESNFLNKYDYIRFIKSLSEGQFFKISDHNALRQLAKANFIGTSGVVIPRAVFDAVGFFDESLANGDDYDMWMRIARDFPLGFIDSVSHYYRIGQRSISSAGARRLAPARIKVLERQLADPLDAEFERDIKYWIAKNKNALSREYIINGEMKEARKLAFDSFCHRKDFTSLKYFFLSFMGSGFVKFLRSSRFKGN
ncbi:MAG: glycosyltransferase family 2 protein [Marinobacter sp.]|nr:glycosyltransferase family 2 protein [Marinobacter sp.]